MELPHLQEAAEQLIYLIEAFHDQPQTDEAWRKNVESLESLILVCESSGISCLSNLANRARAALIPLRVNAASNRRPALSSTAVLNLEPVLAKLREYISQRYGPE